MRSGFSVRSLTNCATYRLWMDAWYGFAVVPEGVVIMSDEAWDAFVADLDAPAKPNPALAELLRSKPRWAARTEGGT